MQDNSLQPGLRARKRAETHARIQTAAFKLFSERGFEDATLDDIAAAADVSRRTLFHYFGSKEDIVLSAKADVIVRIETAIAARPADEPLMDMAEHALTEMAADFQGEGPRTLARLIKATPALQASDHARYDTMERRLTAALTSRKGLAADDLQARMVAIAAIGVLKISTEAWLASVDGNGPEFHGKAAFAALRRTLS
ncbi:TetR family transcriptional regulator [Brevundimonas sp.]|uniref:TetR family transcriptional regulator n=1 Tax=Brevundimonas sp. TaxID=1871086 RepID=UPI00286A211C|nr:TetR family transcriptional regulator [Brevundimonas sp.]